MFDWLKKFLGNEPDKPDLRDLEQRRKGNISAYMSFLPGDRYSLGEGDDVGGTPEDADLHRRADALNRRHQGPTK